MAASNLTTSGNLAAKMALYYDKMALDNLKKHLVYHNLGTSKTLPKNSGI